ncbi:SDR family NAD(P)-dependent oxidoreductase [Rhizobium binae]|uniref:NAD(P)-dependent dehydrogenase (Short-subunit alcohol dehydrogenase family) n=1 Tax=Rhizobium binae TaxID=1138190 RepID=A0ABV2MRE6_9HYPH|nr:SDR family NAD(P)-dependent oxidoreductase [Rhizobium binae]NKL51822.1 SDR family NAD(P)-dependent oxidoreductase [Rhizobium leguminosarum bv. viciae]MBX4938872.1 SDR family NAD(P)-dependent oxidoreductase [Rhizobium binae]MBX4945351.1 SDR family NAD(P)-dependent oxidoreductase [Rhizobium binae]MBX4951131.1 SDR family NAD(P)-dependent oxidoreductase [Rhizobium binae]MBX4963739.1 SDR family NAD(P)-dependent oxidoreductase [Rhizobium binae]
MNDQGAVIVTGAGGNLGSAVVRELAAGGAKLVCMNRSSQELETLAGELPASTEFLSIAGTELTDYASCAAAVARAVKHFGGVSALVNTVGGFQMGPVGPDAPSQWDTMMTANARTALTISAAVLPTMKAAGYGRIVHVAAAPGLKAGANQAAYAASKAAVIRLTEAIAAENRDHRITANCVLPGTIDTPENRAAMPNAKTDGWVSPQSIARLIAFLISPAAAVVTGGAIPATGRE